MIHMIRVECIRPNPWQPRLRENEEKVDQLAESLLENVDRLPKTRKGLLQVPLARVVERHGVELGSSSTHGELLKLAERIEAGEAFAQLAFGHRRWSAFRRLAAGGPGRPPDERFATMPLELAILTNRQMAEAAVRENVEREDLTWYEQAHFMIRIIKDFDVTQAETARILGYGTQSTVGHYLRALRAIEEFGDRGLKQLAIDGYLPMLHVQHLAPLMRDFPDTAHIYLEEGRFFTEEGEVRPASAVKAEIDSLLALLREDEELGEEEVEHDATGQQLPEQAGRDITPLMTSSTHEWYTPAHIIERVKQVLGEIGLDPCSTEEANQVVGARRFFTVEDDGLSKPWDAKNVFMNPPYGDQIGSWVEKLIGEFSSGRVLHAIALLPARTDTRWFQLLDDFPHCYVNGRLNFWGPDDKGNHATFPSVIVALGCDLATFDEAFGGVGRIVQRLGGAIEEREAKPDDDLRPTRAQLDHMIAWFNDYDMTGIDTNMAYQNVVADAMAAHGKNPLKEPERASAWESMLRAAIGSQAVIRRMSDVADEAVAEEIEEPVEDMDGSTLPAWMVEDTPDPNVDRTLDTVSFVVFQLTLAVERLQEELTRVENNEDRAILEHVLRVVSTATNPVCEMLRPLVSAAVFEDLRWRLIDVEGAEERRKVIANFLWENKPQPIIGPKDAPPALQLEEPEDPEEVVA